MENKEANIENLYTEFEGLKNYKEKLKFFDKHFNLIPFTFPSFDAHLDFLLKSDSINLLTEILEKERRKSLSFIKKYYCDKIEFVFDVNPHNSNVHFFNEYVITKFTCNDEHFNDFLLYSKTIFETDKSDVRFRIAEVSSLIEIIKQKIENKKDRTFRKQLFNVFYTGFLDYTHGQLKKFPNKKKLIELYLYSAGILFGKYKETLLEQVYKSKLAVAHISSDSIGYKYPKDKVLLLNELGVTQYLRDKYKNSDEINIKNKIAELFCILTGRE